VDGARITAVIDSGGSWSSEICDGKIEDPWTVNGRVKQGSEELLTVPINDSE